MLPTDKRLFLIILVLFTVAGFGIKSLFFGGKSPVSQTVTPVVGVDKKERLPLEDQQDAKEVAIRFIQAYFQESDLFRDLVTDRLRQILEEERVAVKHKPPRLKKILQAGCDSYLQPIRCVVTGLLEESESSKRSFQREQTYDLQLVQMDGRWRVAEVSVRGSFD